MADQETLWDVHRKQLKCVAENDSISQDKINK